MNINKFIVTLILSLFTLAFSVYSEIIKPVKISASSELKFYKGHLAKYAGDGKVHPKEYWCTDFKNNAKSPHWLEFDFGSPKKINQIQLYMHPLANRIMMLDDFKLEYWDKGEWRQIIEVHDYLLSFVRAVRKKNIPNKYSIKVPDASPIFRFSPITTNKVRLYVTNTLCRFNMTRLHEMKVSFEESPKKELSRKETTTKETKGMYCFDFGTKTSPVKPGFTGITEKTYYSKINKYGWNDTSKIIACDRTYPTDLKRDFMFSNKPASFKIKLPNGKYYLYIFSGDTLFASPGVKGSVNNQSFEVGAGKEQQFASEIIPIEVKSNELEIKFKAPFLINAMVVAPQKYREKLNILSTEILIDPDYNNPRVKFKRVIPETNRTHPKVSVKELNQKYICYVPSTQQRIFPDTAPKQTQIKNNITVSAAPGENKAATLCVYALNDIKNVKISLGNLKSDSGEIFNKKNIDLRVIKCWSQRTGHKGSSKTWAIIPELLVKNAPQMIEEYNSRQFWLTFSVPPNTAPGKYYGTISINGKGLTEKQIKINLTIYSFKLETPPDTVFAMYIGTRRSVFCNDPRSKEWDLKQLIDMKEHGMNSIVFNLNPTTPIEEMIKKIKYCNELLDLVQYPKYPIPFDCRDISPAKVKAVRDAVKKNKWRKMLFYPVDEPFHGAKLKHAQKIYAELKKVKDIRTYSTVYQNSVDKLGDNLDVRCFAVSGAAKFDAKRILRDCQKQNKTFWWYTNGTREYPAVARFKAGFFFWKTGAEGQLYWAYMNSRGDALNDFDTTSSDHCVVYFMDKKIIPTIQWECIREGINDFKYLYTLEQAIKKAPKSKAKECAKARQLLAKIRKETLVDLNEYRKRFGSDLALHIRSAWAPEKYDRYRKEIAEHIIRLNK